jgi:hypothetical protein
MAFDKRLKELVLVFEVGNTQNSYARCLSTINYFENYVLNSNSDVSEFYDSLVKNVPESDFIFDVNQRSNGPNDKMENPLNPDQYARIPVSKNEEKELLIYAVDSWRKDKNNLKLPLYHIRVKFNYDTGSMSYLNIDNLQYLAMLMQQVYITCFFDKEKSFVSGKLAPDELKKRLSVFLVPYTGNPFKFAGKDVNPDTTLYSLTSQYLRLIAKMHNGVIYGHSSSGKVEAIEFKERTRNNMWFPLLYLADTESNGNYHAIFETSGMADEATIRKGFTWRTNDSKPFNKAGDDNPHLAIPDLIMDETRERLLTFFASISKTGLNEKMSRAEILDLGRERIAETINITEKETNFLGEIVKITANCDRFTFALFGYLLFADKDASTESIIKTIRETIQLVRELGDGIRQIVQNAIQYSQYHICYISFFKEYAKNDSSRTEDRLCVRVTDLNVQKNIIETFTETLKAENKYGFFINFDTNISIKHLVGEFGSELPDNISTAWYAFRKTDSAAHIGLTMFYNTLKRCQYRGLQIISSTTPRLQDDNVFTGKNVDNVFSPPRYVISGAQISFSIPITTLLKSLPVNLVQLANSGVFSENYIAFAHYLDYTVSHRLWENHISRMEYAPDVSPSLYSPEITSARSKAKAQNEWKEFWFALMRSTLEVQNRIHFCKINDDFPVARFLKNRDNCEVFIKGFFAAASLYRIEQDSKDAEYCPSCFYFENLPDHFIDILQEVSIPLSLMDFSPNLQVFFSCAQAQDEKDRKQQPKQIVVLGNSVGHAIQNAYIMSLEHGEQSIDPLYYVRASEMLMPYKAMFALPLLQLVCPFTVFGAPDTGKIPQYFIQIAEISERPLVEKEIGNRGYRFPKIHMRLGNKVHTASFYEMSFLFYRTSVANRVAFYILQKIKEDLHDINGCIVFFGYASYSQALIISLREMLKVYFENKNNPNEVHYATYQFNLQAESDYSGIAEKPNDKMRIYSTLKAREDGEKIRTYVVQIVPIGSTLTTFDKMWAKYLKDRGAIEKTNIIANYNIFLVRDEEKDRENNVLSGIEHDLWTSFSAAKQEVTVNTSKLRYLESKPEITYIIKTKSKWSRPMECKQCFPDLVQNEVPLVETDPTSTVPALQVYQKEPSPQDDSVKDATVYSPTDNGKRLAELYGCIFYGHFVRGKNHFQYYIDTQEFTLKNEKNDQLKIWLTEERKKEDMRMLESNVKTTPVLNIIFAPEHNTNVGFSQSVNAHYFNGTAEIVSVNVDKQFRSNFICEHDALRQIMERLYAEKPDEKSVHFFFVDDSIISGTSYYRANDLLKSLIPKEKRDGYRGTVFSKCFILVNRLSLATQESYIDDPQNNFLSFCHLNISNMRKQGDSCVGCKLEREAKHLFKRSSTRSFANYWARKTDSHDTVMFDNVDKRKDYGGEKAFVRMLLTHVVETLMEKYDKDNNGNMSSSEKVIQHLFALILRDETLKLRFCVDDDEETYLVETAFEKLSAPNKDATVFLLKHAVKLLSRPFLSYNIELKKYVMRFIINVCEFLLTEESSAKIPVILEEQERVADKIKTVLAEADTNGEKRLDFLKNCLFEALADMESTYLLRKETIKKAYQFTGKYVDLKSEGDICPHYNQGTCQCIVPPRKENDDKKNDYRKNFPCGNSQVRCFWKKYAFHIQYIIDGGGDETRSLWMEHLIVCGEEFSGRDPVDEGKIGEGVTLPLFESIKSDITLNEEAERLFREFCMEIFLQNSRLLYDGIEKHCEKSDGESGENSEEKKSLLGIADTPWIDTSGTPWIDPSDNSYFLQNLYKMRNWDLEWASIRVRPKKVTDSEKIMFNYLLPTEKGLEDTDEKYKKFIEVIIDMIKDKYNIFPENLCVALMTQKGLDESDDMKDFDFIPDNIPQGKLDEDAANTRYFIKQRIIWALKEKIYGNTRLLEDGYCLMMPIGEKKSGDCFDYEKDDNAFRKPFFILRFDNLPGKRVLKLDREAQPIEKVFLYISFDFVSTEAYKEKVAPLLIMRDILSYRHRIMRMLEQDFNSHLMQIHARKAGENAILKHEKTVSHTLTSDDQLPMAIWDMNIKGKLIKDKDHDFKYEWLLFRNYINIQIAKLFNRTLLLDDDKKTFEQKPNLYLGEKDINTDDIFAMPAKEFLTDVFNDSDRRVILCKEIIEIKHERLENGRLVTPTFGKAGGYFNREYLKCVLFDIFLTCAKYWHEGENFLSRINYLKSHYDDYLRAKKEDDDGKRYKESLDSFDNKRCKIFLIRDENDLVIINPVSRKDNNFLNGQQERNDQIRIRLRNQNDSFDGHMSLLTINNYIKHNSDGTPMFKYILYKELLCDDKLKPEWKQQLDSQWRIPRDDNSVWFVTKLPIFI